MNSEHPTSSVLWAGETTLEFPQEWTVIVIIIIIIIIIIT
jgi:hypothetical protein